jgi:hypothetical protein
MGDGQVASAAWDRFVLDREVYPMRPMAAWCFRHRGLVVVGWLLLSAAVFGLARNAGADYSSSISLPDTESTRH